jgi:hypothetical protein
VAELCVLAVTAWAAWRRRQALIGAAIVAGMLRTHEDSNSLLQARQNSPSSEAGTCRAKHKKRSAGVRSPSERRLGNPFGNLSGNIGQTALHSADITPHLNWEYVTGEDGVDGRTPLRIRRLGVRIPPSAHLRARWIRPAQGLQRAQRLSPEHLREHPKVRHAGQTRGRVPRRPRQLVLQGHRRPRSPDRQARPDHQARVPHRGRSRP